jgi:hypothetical protein
MKKSAPNNYFFATLENLEAAIDRAFAALLAPLGRRDRQGEGTYEDHFPNYMCG